MTLKNDDNISEFGRRILCLMEEKDIKSPKQLAKILYEKELVSVMTRGEYNSKEVNYNNAINSIEKKIRRHIKANSPLMLQGEFLIAYCKYFECSADYILGLTNVKSIDLETRVICERVGLSEKAIKYLENPAPDEMAAVPNEILNECWNALLESDLSNTLPIDYLNISSEFNDLNNQEWDITTAQHIATKCNNEIVAAREEVKIKSIKKQMRSHEPAIYGYLAKISRDVSYAIEEYVIKKYGSDNTKQKEHERAILFADEILKGSNKQQ